MRTYAASCPTLDCTPCHYYRDAMRRLVKKIRLTGLLSDQEGATAIEYALMASLIAVAVISSVGLLANKTKDSLNSSGDAINPVLGN